MGSRLGQQELLALPPVRRIIVPPGHGAWWGIDPSTRGVSIAYIDREGCRGVRTVPFASGEGPARLAAILAETRLLVARLAADVKPGVVMVEQPSGKADNPALLYAVGVIQAAVYLTLARMFERAIRVETVTAAHWKKVACGRGNIHKPGRRGEPYGVLTWAVQNGYQGSSWDEADALGIAECAWREIGLVER